MRFTALLLAVKIRKTNSAKKAPKSSPVGPIHDSCVEVSATNSAPKANATATPACPTNLDVLLRPRLRRRRILM